MWVMVAPCERKIGMGRGAVLGASWGLFRRLPPSNPSRFVLLIPLSVLTLRCRWYFGPLMWLASRSWAVEGRLSNWKCPVQVVWSSCCQLEASGYGLALSVEPAHYSSRAIHDRARPPGSRAGWCSVLSLGVPFSARSTGRQCRAESGFKGA